ncbi:hypothetical protein DOTSEDRAFT_53823 [Dothistroma septosporum NZE10]|uniref:non-specific serine/threonine protein kinase n=1 Tax=Dothistroma septosporum (strain NZE10 / CBS 128990) TaxID=675120 RepID=M2YLD7_DOTSN|nr:hypothetical protein DOTSEDRAFT_53823 [Dothistroma septosporum NZE10]
MAPKSPWNKKTTLHPNVQRAAAANDVAAPAINYGEVQDEEIAVLEAIYMDDYEEVAVKTAWSKTTDKSFKLKVRPGSDLAHPDEYVVLSVQLTATYPKSVPILEVSGLDKFHERTQQSIINVIRLRPKQMVGEVMIHAIATEIQEALEDAVNARAQGVLPSLDEERASAEEVALGLAKEAEEAEVRRQQKEQEEEDRVLKQMVSKELTRQEKRKSIKPSKEASSHAHEETTAETVIFDQHGRLKVGNDPESFAEVTIINLTSTTFRNSTFEGIPVISGVPRPPKVAIVRRKVERPRSEIFQLEAALEAARKLDHVSLVALLAFRVDKINNHNSELVLCQEWIDGKSLHHMLSLSSMPFGVAKAKQYTTQLLEGLEFVHSNGLTHGGINTHVIFFSSTPTLAPKLADFGYASFLGLADEDTPMRWRYHDGSSTSTSSQRQRDIWDLGLVVLQMLLGLDVLNDFTSPPSLVARLDLSDALEDFLNKIFTEKRRTTCFDLLPAEFLRTDAPILQEAASLPLRGHRTRKSSSGFSSPYRRSRHNSSNVHEPYSRYANDFTDLGRLGKGGFGEVVKARNKLDGGVYAVKKIRQMPHLLEQVLKEVVLLNRLNHPYVVRYYSTWVENDVQDSPLEDAISTTEDTPSEGPNIDFGYPSTGGLDFVSSSGYQGIEFGDDDDDEDDSNSDDDPFERKSAVAGNGTSATESEETSQAENLRLNKTRSDSRRNLMSTLYIQMELCDRRSLRDLIRKGLSDDESWRLIRQITEGLAHVHEHHIIHRDLKPDNVFIDAAGNPKLGDFGLATPGQQFAMEKQGGSKGHGSVDMTRSIGTAMYVAPELQSTSGTNYDAKVDMFSLGIMFFEMCQAFSTAMERINELVRMRQKDHDLPSAFQTAGDKAMHGRLINRLISHKPSERPKASELLHSDMLPLKVEDETIRQALLGLKDEHSPYHQQLMSALFAHDSASSQRVKARAWEEKASTTAEETNRIRLRNIARISLENVFRRYGAEESRRDSIFPRSGIYAAANVVQLLDSAGNLLQLPFDMTLPYAQQLARQAASIRCNFTFGGAFRDSFTGGPPRVSEEVDFDIVNLGRDEDIAWNDAEVIKVMDEVISELPTFDTVAGIVLQLNHGRLLDAILDHCRVPIALQHVLKEALSKLGVHQMTWLKLRPELRTIGLSDTTLDDLQQFDWRASPEQAMNRLKSLLETATVRIQVKSDEAIQHLRRILTHLETFGIIRRLCIAPLSAVNAKFYESGMLVQCLLERKKNSVVIAAGGRYDSLVRAHRVSETSNVRQGAVGLCIGIDTIVAHMMKICAPGSKGTFLKDPGQNNQLAKRCDVCVVAEGTDQLRDAGRRLLASLRANFISAELYHPSFPDQNCNFIVTMRHETSHTVRVSSTTNTSEDTDVAISSLVPHIQQELREQANSKARRPLLRHHSSHQDTDRKPTNVQVLMARHGSKKSNKYGLVESVEQNWSEKLEKLKGVPKLAIETRDEVLDLIKRTRLSDGESWKKCIQSVQLSERQYVQQVQEMLEAWRKSWEQGDGVEEVCVCNFRSGRCVYYDLGQ